MSKKNSNFRNDYLGIRKGPWMSPELNEMPHWIKQKIKQPVAYGWRQWNWRIVGKPSEMRAKCIHCLLFLWYNLSSSRQRKQQVKYRWNFNLNCFLLGSSLLDLLCILEPSLAPPIDGAVSWISVVATHLWGFPIYHTCTTLPHRPHQSLSGSLDSYLSCRQLRTGCLNVAFFCSVSCINFVYFWFLPTTSVYLSLLQPYSVFFTRVCFSAHLVDIKAVFFTYKLCRVWKLNTHP